MFMNLKVLSLRLRKFTFNLNDNLMIPLNYFTICAFIKLLRMNIIIPVYNHIIVLLSIRKKTKIHHKIRSDLQDQECPGTQIKRTKALHQEQAERSAHRWGDWRLN